MAAVCHHKHSKGGLHETGKGHTPEFISLTPQ